MPPGTPHWHPVLKKISPEKLIPRSRNGPIFLSKDQLTEKKDRVLIKDLINNK